MLFKISNVKLTFKKAFTCFLSGLVSSFIFPSMAYTQGDMVVIPKRIVFEGSKRSAQLSIANTGLDTATYYISFIQIRMNEDGTFEKIPQSSSAQYFSDKNVRFFPHSVKLAPNESQTVRIQTTKTNELAPGEYRSHLYLRAIPPEKPLGEKELVKDSVISIKMVPLFGISVPVIIRIGENTSAVSLSNVSFQIEKDTLPVVNMTFNRTGNMSVYGDVSVNHISLKGKVTPVGSAKGLAVYTPIGSRRFSMFLEKNRSIDFTSGKLHIVYSDQSSKAVKLAEEEIVLH